MNEFLFSVIVPIYKAELYLRRAIDSVLNQRYKKYEIILIDDGSPDACPEICDEYGASYCNIKVFHEANGGVSVARNKGISVSKGDIICFLDADDIWDENYLEQLFIFYNEYPYIGAATTARWNQLNNGKKILVEKKYTSKYSVCKDFFRLSSCIITSSYSIRRNIVAEVGIFEEGVRRGEDVDFMVRACCKSEIGYINVPLITYFVDSEFNSSNTLPQFYFRFYKWYDYDYPVKKELYIHTTGKILKVTKIFWQNGLYVEAIKNFLTIRFLGYIYYKLLK